jgi:hypothetical protein
MDWHFYTPVKQDSGEYQFTACGLYDGMVTIDPDEVTCQTCKTKMKEL